MIETAPANHAARELARIKTKTSNPMTNNKAKEKAPLHFALNSLSTNLFLRKHNTPPTTIGNKAVR